MKVLGVRAARSAWLVPQYFLNPKGLFLRPAAIQMKQRYNFLKGPFDNNTAGTEQVKYEHGGFASKSGASITIGSVTFHPDGVVVDTQASTDVADEFLEDVGNWLTKDYGLPQLAEAPIRKLYASEVNVMFNKRPAFLNPKLKPFIDAVSEAIALSSSSDVGLLTFQLATDVTKAPRQNAFRIDYEANTAYEENRFYSYAPLRTTEHLKILEQLEACL